MGPVCAAQELKIPTPLRLGSKLPSLAAPPLKGRGQKLNHQPLPALAVTRAPLGGWIVAARRVHSSGRYLTR